MAEGKPITTWIVTALVLWAIYLWRSGRLGKSGVLPHPAEVAGAAKGPLKFDPGHPAYPKLELPPGWRSGAPPKGNLPPAIDYVPPIKGS